MNAHYPKKLLVRGSSGFSIIESLVAIGLLGVAVTVGFSLFTTQMKSKQLLDKASWKNSLRMNVKAFMSCSRTMESGAAACGANDFVDVKRLDGSILAKDDGTSSVGPFNVRARCDERDLMFEFKETGGSGDWASLYDDIPVRCKAPDPKAVEQITVLSNIAFFADEGTEIYFDLKTGRWGDLTLAGATLDGDYCKDVVGLIAMVVQPWGFNPAVNAGMLRLKTYDGELIDWAMGTGWRFNPLCAASAWGKQWYSGLVGPNCVAADPGCIGTSADPKQMPGVWGANTSLKNASITYSPLGDGNVTIYQSGSRVYFKGWRTSIFSPTISFSFD